MSVTGSCFGQNWERSLRHYETAFCSPLALMVLEKILKDLAMFLSFWPKIDFRSNIMTIFGKCDHS
jgi:hypothetical protein